MLEKDIENLLLNLPVAWGIVELHEGVLLHIAGNRALAEMLNISERDLRSRNLDELGIFPTHAWMKACENVTHHDATEKFSFWQEGHQRHFTVSLSGIIGEPEHQRLTYVLQDTTEIVTIRESEERYKVVIDAIPDIIWTATPDGTQDYANLRWFEFNGIERGPTAPEVWRGIIHPDDVKNTADNWYHSLKTGEPYNCLHRNRRFDGEFRWVLTRAVPQRDENGKIIRWIGSGTDITELRQAEEAYRESEQRFRRAIMDTPFPTLMHADDGEIILLNREWQTLTGFEPNEVKTINAWTALAYGERQQDATAYIRTFFELEEAAYTGEWLITTKTGKKRVWDMSATPLGKLPDGRRLVLSMARDITDLKSTQKELENAIRARDEFLSIASHELKTPLTSLKLQSQMITRTLEKFGNPALGSFDLKRAAARISNQSNKLNRLVENMLDITRIENGRLVLDKKKTSLSDIVSEVLESFKDELLESGVELRALVEPGISAFVDHFRIEQVFTNLISNALKYGSSARPIEVTLKKLNQNIAEFVVKDYGSGISEDDQNRIFGRYERAVPGSKISGFGLGLYIVKDVLELHKGQIRVESAPGKGSKFIIHLPLGEATHDA